MTRNGKFRWRDSWKNMQNCAIYGVSEFGGADRFFFPIAMKSEIGKLYERNFSTFRSSWGAWISLTVATMKLQTILDLFLRLSVQLCTGKLIFLRMENGDTMWNFCCDLYANCEGKSWITLKLNLIINSWKILKSAQLIDEKRI